MENLGPNDTRNPDYLNNYQNDMGWRDRTADCVFRFEQAMETRLAHFKQTPKEITEYVMHEMFVGPGPTKEIARAAILFPYILRDKIRDIKLASICASLRVGLAVAKAANGVFKYI